MQLARENTVGTKNASLASINVLPLGLVKTSGSLTPVAVNALYIVARAAIPASRHASHDAQGLNLGFCWNAFMLVCALVSVGTFLAQIVDVAHFQFADAVDFGFVEGARWVYALAFAVARDA
jgi:hypothetical protein